MSIDRASQCIDPHWWKTKPVARKLLSAARRPGACLRMLKTCVEHCRTYGPRVTSPYGLRDMAVDLYGQLAIAWAYGLPPDHWFAYRYWEADWSTIGRYSDITLLQGWLNERRAAPDHLSACTDKTAFYRFCTAHEIPTIPVLGCAAEGEYTGLARPAANGPPRHALVVKPATASGGAAVRILRFDEAAPANGAHVDEDGTLWRWNALTRTLAQASKQSGAATVVQPLVRNASSWQPFTNGGLATARLLTGRFPDEQVECLRASLRMPVGDARLDNFSRGNLAAAIDLDTGRLGPAVSKYPLPTGHSFEHHPDTEARIVGAALPGWSRLRACARRLHEHLRIPLLGLDVTQTRRGARVVEANPFHGRTSLEIPHGTPLSATRVPAVVRAWMPPPRRSHPG